MFFRLVFISLFDERTGSLIQAVRRFFSRAHTLTGALRGAKATLKRAPYVGSDVPIFEYLTRLAEAGENPEDYESIWYYF